ncbi:unnamed protein product, partial [Nesidiocoris tenuis]
LFNACTKAIAQHIRAVSIIYAKIRAWWRIHVLKLKNAKSMTTIRHVLKVCFRVRGFCWGEGIFFEYSSWRIFRVNSYTRTYGVLFSLPVPEELGLQRWHTRLRWLPMCYTTPT